MKFPKGRASERVIADIGSIRRALERETPPELGPAITDEAQLKQIAALPALADTQVEGALLNAQLKKPAPGMPPLSQAPNPAATLAGSPLIDTLLPRA